MSNVPPAAGRSLSDLLQAAVAALAVLATLSSSSGVDCPQVGLGGARPCELPLCNERGSRAADRMAAAEP